MLIGLVCAGGARADEPSGVREATLRATPQGYVLDADVKLALNRTLADALERGIHLHFLLELEITRPRGWWWFDEDIAEPVRKMHVYYHLLLRRYVVENGYTTRTVDSLAEALAFMGRVTDWQVLEPGALQTGKPYAARLRLRLDTAQLPKPLSIAAVSGDRWELVTPWYAWSFDAPALPVAP
ncbi:MAG: hypothetical protein BGO61_07205 [Thiobacillus sp. 65-69]|nr:MAG: hypothetical protein ABT21_01995 [Thiobacillus sp. SCN 65-179]OJW36108.1 MAG: hypothetical protein BGO61_07205 [Thiobacillus sp. 65-69]